MIDIKILFAILIIHWIADFVLQTDAQAKGKSNNWKDLLHHTFTYSSIWLAFITIICILGVIFNFTREDVGWSTSILYFPLITFILHTITDYYTSRVNSQLWKDGKTHDFFVAIGFDQLLHYIQLILTYYYLTN